MPWSSRLGLHARPLRSKCRPLLTRGRADVHTAPLAQGSLAVVGMRNLSVLSPQTSGLIQDLANELRRINLLRGWVNRVPSGSVYDPLDGPRFESSSYGYTRDSAGYV